MNLQDDLATARRTPQLLLALVVRDGQTFQKLGHRGDPQAQQVVVEFVGGVMWGETFDQVDRRWPWFPVSQVSVRYKQHAKVPGSHLPQSSDVDLWEGMILVPYVPFLVK